MLSDTLIIGSSMIKLDAIGSTNDFAHDLLTKEEEIVEGTVVIAENQSKGRGQRGNSWIVEPGQNLTFSIVLYPKFLSPSDQFQLSKAISLGILSFLREALPVNMSAITVKWPNDIYIGTKKVCGMLIENAVGGSKMVHSVVGIGLNVNQETFDKSLPNPTSMKLLAGAAFNINSSLEALCGHLDRRYIELRNGAHNRIHEEYMDNLFKYQVWSDFEVEGAAVHGRITGVDGSGKLILEQEDGEEVSCDYKEVVFC